MTVTDDDLRDRLAIMATLAELAAAIDARDWPAVAAVFNEDATAYGAEGVDAILRRMREHLDGCGPTQHLIGNHRITVDGDSARSRSAARVHHVGAGAYQGRFFECLGDYEDHWVRVTGSGWRLCYRRFDMRITLGDRGVLRPA